MLGRNKQTRPSELIHKWDYLLRVVVSDVEAYNRFLMETLLTHAAVAQVPLAFRPGHDQAHHRAATFDRDTVIGGGRGQLRTAFRPDFLLAGRCAEAVVLTLLHRFAQKRFERNCWIGQHRHVRDTAAVDQRFSLNIILRGIDTVERNQPIVSEIGD